MSILTVADMRADEIPMARTRRLDGEQLVWECGPMFVARLERVG
jgi:hypothetical protein